VINTRTEDVVNSFNEKTEPVRNVMNSVKDSTTSTIQQGKETVSNVASATVNKASGVADSVYSFCESRVPGAQRRNSSGLSGFAFSTIGSLFNYTFQTVQSSLLWFRMLVVFVLLKTKQVNDVVLNKIQHLPFLPVFSQRLLINAGSLLEYSIGQIRPDDRTLAELKKSKQQSRVSQQPQYYPNRQSVKSNPPVTTRQSVVVTKQETVVTRTSNSNQYSQSQPQPDYSNLTDKEELYARLANSDLTQSTYNVETDLYTTETVDVDGNGDIAQLHSRLNPTDVELLYARLPSDTLPVVDNDEPLNHDQQQLHAKVIAAELERQGYPVDDEE